jgi:hypothetical protein
VDNIDCGDRSAHTSTIDTPGNMDTSTKVGRRVYMQELLCDGIKHDRVDDARLLILADNNRHILA